MGLSISADTFIKFLEENGYHFVRQNGTSHKIYNNGEHSISVSYHKGRNIDDGMVSQMLRECGISKKELLRWLGRK